IYGNKFDKRFFVPAEKIVLNFITLNIVEDSNTSHQDVSVRGKSNDVWALNEPLEDQEPHQEEMEVKNSGYALHWMDIFCDSEESSKGMSLTQQGSLGETMPTEKAAVGYEEAVRTVDICVGTGDQELRLQEEASHQGQFLEQQAALADLGSPTPLYPYATQLRDLGQLLPKHVEAEEEPGEEASTTLVDWDPQTGRLCIPSFSGSELDSEGCEQPKYKELTEESLLCRLYEDQAPEESSEENKAYLLKFMEDWGLHVQMED
ncbi:interleukin-20 receptor subunit alpha-like, partial [Mustela nigripes]